MFDGWPVQAMTLRSDLFAEKCMNYAVIFCRGQISPNFFTRASRLQTASALCQWLLYHRLDYTPELSENKTHFQRHRKPLYQRWKLLALWRTANVLAILSWSKHLYCACENRTEVVIYWVFYMNFSVIAESTFYINVCNFLCDNPGSIAPEATPAKKIILFESPIPTSYYWCVDTLAPSRSHTISK